MTPPRDFNPDVIDDTWWETGGMPAAFVEELIGGGRPPRGRIVAEAGLLEVVSVRGGTYALVESGKTVLGRGLRLDEAQAVLELVCVEHGGLITETRGPCTVWIQEKKCGRSGIPDDHTCHIGGGGSLPDMSTDKVKSREVLGSDSVNKIIQLTMADGTQVIFKHDNGGKIPTDDELMAYLDGRNPAAVSQHPEVAAYELQEMVGLEAGVPASNLQDVPGLGRGLVQEKVEGLTNVKEIMDEAEAAYYNGDEGAELMGWADVMETCTPESVAQVAVLDCIMGNMDRHTGNCMIVGDELVGVDNGLPLEYSQEYTFGSGAVYAVQHVGGAMGQEPTAHQERAWQETERIIANLPDVDEGKWMSRMSDGTELGDRFGRASYRRYQLMRERGVLLPPQMWPDR